MIKFGQIRKIIDHYTECCNNCDYGNYKDCSHPDCDTFIALQMKNEIMDLLDNADVKTDAISMVPCVLSYKGFISELPKTAENGDAYTIRMKHNSGFYGWESEDNYYWYENEWHYLPTCDIHIPRMV